jgi:glycosyltransferase involved in cell wall biosynthesis
VTAATHASAKPADAAPDARVVSVVMPCHNAARYVEEAVGSALGQTHRALELVVVDDGSTDGSGALLDRLAAAEPGRMRVLHTACRGAYPARNAGLHEARGEFVAFLDADDWRH